MFDSDSDAWEETAITVARSIVMNRKRSRKGKWLYRGELDLKLGKKQAKKFIAQQKYEHRLDAQQDDQWRFIEDTDELEGILSQGQTLTQKGSRLQPT